MKNAALTVSGILYAIVAIIHIIRYYQSWVVVISNYVIPLHASIYAAIVFALLAAWMFVAVSKKK